MSRIEGTQPSHLNIHHLDSPGLKKALDVFLNLLSSCAGPSGKIHMIRNSCGGYVTLTSTCARLLASMQVTFPELKLVVTAVQSHITQHNDCGLFMACTCLRIIQSSITERIQFHVHKLLLESFVQIILGYLNSSDCRIRVRADFTDLKVLLAYVKSVINSKRLLNLTGSGCSKLSELVMRAFVESIPANAVCENICFSDGVYILCLEGLDVNYSRVKHGLLLEYPELSALNGPVNLNVKIRAKNSGRGEINSDGPIEVALFTCSMSGDLEEVTDSTFEVSREVCEDVESAALDKIIGLCELLDRCEVDLILCQKVIHPKIKARLRLKGILFADRLGSQKIPFLQDLTGAHPISSVIATLDLGHHLGLIDTVRHVVMSDKSYLHLSKSSSHVVTLVLCASLEERLVELKNCVKASLSGLYSLAKEHRLLAGGGCWQTLCSYVLKDKVSMQLQALASQAGCSEALVLSSLAIFRSGLHHWVRSLAKSSEDVLVDPSSLHCWRVLRSKQVNDSATEISACCCGLKIARTVSLQDFSQLSGQTHFLSGFPSQNFSESKTSTADNTDLSDVVLDNFTAATQALERSVSTANLIMSIGLFISDKS